MHTRVDTGASLSTGVWTMVLEAEGFKLKQPPDNLRLDCIQVLRKRGITRGVIKKVASVSDHEILPVARLYSCESNGIIRFTPTQETAL